MSDGIQVFDGDGHDTEAAEEARRKAIQEAVILRKPKLEIEFLDESKPPKGYKEEGSDSLLFATGTFFVIALVSALFGFTGIAAEAAGISKVLFFIFIVLFVVSLVAHALRRGP